MKTKNLLILARQLIDTPEKWAQGQYCYRRASGPAYCALGAIYETAAEQAKDGEEEVRFARDAIAAVVSVAHRPIDPHHDRAWLMSFNDRGEYHQVRELFDTAINNLS